MPFILIFLSYGVEKTWALTENKGFIQGVYLTFKIIN
jgi:hypothetical protein